MNFSTKKAAVAGTQHSYWGVTRSYLGGDIGYTDLRFLMVFLSPQGKCQDNTYINPWPLLPNPYQFIIYESS
jgi:hypothetical protein